MKGIRCDTQRYPLSLAEELAGAGFGDVREIGHGGFGVVYRCTQADLDRMDECFLLGTTRDLVPVAGIDDRRFKVGPDTVTTRLKAAFARYAREYADAHPELAV